MRQRTGSRKAIDSGNRQSISKMEGKYMLGIEMQEWVIVWNIELRVFEPGKLPGFGSSLGTLQEVY
jgi:hypothetical protein